MAQGRSLYNNHKTLEVGVQGKGGWGEGQGEVIGRLWEGEKGNGGYTDIMGRGEGSSGEEAYVDVMGRGKEREEGKWVYKDVVRRGGGRGRGGKGRGVSGALWERGRILYDFKIPRDMFTRLTVTADG